jgi:outer membrane protein
LKKIFVVSALAWGVLSLAQAQTPAPPPAAPAAPAVIPTKVAVINIQAAILSTADGKKAAGDLSAKFDSRKVALQKRNTDLQAKVEQLRKGGATMSDEARAKLLRENDAENKALTRDGEDLNADIDQEQQKLMNDLGSKMFDLVAQYATANGYVMVLNVSDMQTPVLWHHPSTDITMDIVKLYDQSHPAGAAAKPAAPAPPPGKKQ